MKLKITEPGKENFTGVIQGVAFANGTTVRDVALKDVNAVLTALASVRFRAVVVEEKRPVINRPAKLAEKENE